MTTFRDYTFFSINRAVSFTVIPLAFRHNTPTSVGHSQPEDWERIKNTPYPDNQGPPVLT